MPHTNFISVLLVFVQYSNLKTQTYSTCTPAGLFLNPRRYVNVWISNKLFSFKFKASNVFHLKHQKCENVISHIKILTVKPFCSCFMHLRVTEMPETFVSDGWQSEIRSKNVVLNYFLSLTEVLQPTKTSKSTKYMSVCLKNTERWSPFSVFGHDWEIKTSTAVGVPQSQKNSVLMWIQDSFWLNEGSYLNQYHLDLKCDSYYSEW